MDTHTLPSHNAATLGEHPAPAYDEHGRATRFLEDVRTQLEASHAHWVPTEDGYAVSGTTIGLPFMVAHLLVDAETETCQLEVDLNMAVPPERSVEASRYLRRLNAGMRLRGLVLDDEGWLFFRTDRHHPLTIDDDLDTALRRALLTCHHYVDELFALSCGAHAWELEGETFKPDHDTAPASDTASSDGETTSSTDADTPDGDLADLLSRLMQ